MARNQMPSAQKIVTPTAPADAGGGFVTRPIGGGVVPPMRGGSAGVVPAQAAKPAVRPGGVVGSALRGEREGAPVAREYQVENGGHVVLNGFRTAMRAGKILKDTDYDIQALRDQGLVLRDLNPPPAPPIEVAPVEEPAREASSNV